MEFLVSYKTDQPLISNKPSLKIIGGSIKPIKILFFKDNELVYIYNSFGNEEVSPRVCQYYCKWDIMVYDNNKLIFKDSNNLKNKKVFIKFDSFALGDTIAWMPYVLEFKKKHSCDLHVSTFHNYLFEECYPEIKFEIPNTNLENVYAQYYIGANDKFSYSPINHKFNNLQKICSSTLGLTHIENLKPKIKKFNHDKIIKDDYIIISISASDVKKTNNDIEFWINLVNDMHYLNFVFIGDDNFNDYDKLIKCQNVRVINGRLDYHIIENLISNATLFIGFSSGLSWLSWALNQKTILMSHVTPFFHEPSDLIRIGDNNLSEVNYDNIYEFNLDELKFKIKSQLN